MKKVYYVGYRYFNTFSKPSYELVTDYHNFFDISEIKLFKYIFEQNGRYCNRENTGKTAGKEVVQLFSHLQKNIDKPSSELKAFGKTNLLQWRKSNYRFDIES
jgi:beta-glucosidase